MASKIRRDEMNRRALLIGSETGSLRGVHRDVNVMAETLNGFEFDVAIAIEGDATAAGIRGSYGELIEDSKPDDAVVVYYSGHGGRSRNPGPSQDDSLPAHLQYIVPTDIDDRSHDRFNGVLAEELSAMQRELTGRTPNVTTIIDCCHSARMFPRRKCSPESRPARLPVA